MMRRPTVAGLTFALIFSIASAAGIANAFAGQTTRVSVNSAGDAANGNGLRGGGLSADGHYVVFGSTATNLGAGELGANGQVYRRECNNRGCTIGTTEVVSERPDGAASSGFSPSVSANGRYVAFVSFSTDLVAGAEDTNGAADVFLRDMTPPRSTRLVSAIATGTSVRAVGGTLLNTPDAHVVSVAVDGTVFVAFVSASPDLATDLNRNNMNPQIYVKNMTTGAVELVSQREGVAGDGASSFPALSGDGRYVAFTSMSKNLTSPALGTFSSQIYVRDLTEHTTSLESVTWDGQVLLGGQNSMPALSDNGRYLAFESTRQLDNRPDGDRDVNTWDVYLRDRGDGTTAPTTELVSRSDTPTSFPTLDSRSPSISADGDFVAFHSVDPALVANDDNGYRDVFLYDRTTTPPTLTLVSRNDDGVQANLPSSEPSLSGDGTLVLFASAATNLFAPATTNLQLYLRQLRTNQAPVIDSVTLSPASPRTNDVLQSSVAAHDADGDPLTYTFTWKVNGVIRAVKSGPNASSSFDLALAGDGDRGDTVLVEVVASDGSLQSTTASASAVVVNSAPIVDAGPDQTVTEGSWLKRVASFSDADTSTLATATFDFGAGPLPLSLDADKKLLYLNHEPLTPGDYVVKLSVTDDAGATGFDTFNYTVTNVPPLVSLPSSLDVAFRTLDTSGSFTDPGSGLGETYSATVDYGEGAGPQTLALVGGSFTLHYTYAGAGTYNVKVTVSDSSGDSTAATLVAKVGVYSYEFLDPVASSFVVDRNLPVKFTVRGPDGSPVFDPTVRVDVVDDSGVLVAGPYRFGDQPSRSVTWSSDSYHVNVDTRGFAPGMYWLRVQFSSPTLTGEFRLGTTGTLTSVSPRGR
jgi:hypothetical protein